MSCPSCGAIRIDDQIGLEPTPDEYVAKLVAVFREVKRVLKDDGVLWLNLGDSYVASATGSQGNRSTLEGGKDTQNEAGKRPDKNPVGNLKEKDLIGIPWLVAFALRADGWYLRLDIIWSKPNPMPESVKDRPTKAHEYVFLLSKSQKYYYDADAVREPLTESSIERGKYGWDGNTGDAMEMGATPGGGGFNKLKQTGKPLSELYNPLGRNKRSVWTVNTQPFKGAHFAVMPEKLVEPCVLAGSRPGDVVLDPFAGSGTVGVVAQKFGRQFIGIELNPEYVKLAEKRLLATPQSLFNQSILQETN